MECSQPYTKTKKVILLGTLGIGKSTLGNELLDLTGKNAFETSDRPQGCTLAFNCKEKGDLSVIDTPGLDDPSLTILEWLELLQ
jgi:putative ribosome biogenesis GTPase RsgA